MHRDLLHALSTGWVEDALGVSRAAVADWRRGKFPERRRIELIQAVLALLPDTAESPQPEWARAMESRLRLELRLNRALIEGENPELIDGMRAELHDAEFDEPPHDAERPTGSQRPRGTGLGTPL